MTKITNFIISVLIGLALAVLLCAFLKTYDECGHRGGQLVRGVIWFTCVPKDYGVLHAN